MMTPPPYLSLAIQLIPIYLAGNVHCMGMCGPLMVLLGKHPRRHAYFLGRLLSYSLISGLCGTVGQLLMRYPVAQSASTSATTWGSTSQDVLPSTISYCIKTLLALGLLILIIEKLQRLGTYAKRIQRRSTLPVKRDEGQDDDSSSGLKKNSWKLPIDLQHFLKILSSAMKRCLNARAREYICQIIAKMPRSIHTVSFYMTEKLLQAPPGKRQSLFMFTLGLLTVLIPCGQTLFVFAAAAIHKSFYAGAIAGALLAAVTTPALLFAMELGRKRLRSIWFEDSAVVIASAILMYQLIWS